MKPLLEATNLETNFSSQEFTIDLGREQVAHFTRLLVTHQYNKPLLASVREIVSNAYDANLETKQKTGVMPETVITIFEDRISVRDYGPGLDQESIQSLYSVIGRSTKHNNSEQIGAYGIGRLAPLALNKNFFVESFYNGTKNLYCVYLNEHHIPAVSLWDSEPTTEQNGLNVFILVPPKERKINNSHDSAISSEVLFSSVYEIVDGSRYPVKVKSDIKYQYDRLTREHNLPEHLYFTLDLEDFSVDYYLKEKISHHSGFATSNDEWCSVYFDLGGALYPVDARLGTRNFKPDNGLPSNVIRNAEQVLSQVNTRFESLNGFSYKRDLSRFCVIIRLKPGDLMLNTSREEIVLSDEQKDKIKSIQARALTAVNEELQRRAQKNINEIFLEETKDVKTTQEEFRVAANLFKDYPLNPVFVADKNNETLALSVQLSNGLTVQGIYQTHARNYGYYGTKVNRSIAHILKVEDNIQVTLSSSSYSNSGTPGTVSCKANKMYLLADHQKCEVSDEVKKIMDGAFKTGTSKFHANLATGTSIRFNWLTEDLQVILALCESNLTHRGLAKVLGEEVINKPVIVLNFTIYEVLAQADDYFTRIKDCINYLGIYHPPVVEKPTSKASTVTKLKNEDEREISILLRQLNKDSSRADIVYFDPEARAGLSNMISPPICINKDENFRYTEDILTKKVIYWRADDVVRSKYSADTYIIRQSACNILRHLPSVFYKEYDYQFRVTLTDKAADRVELLRRKGLCNWIEVEELVAIVMKKYFQLWGAQGNFMSSGTNQKILEYLIKSPLKPYLPKPTLRLHYWAAHLKQMLVSFPMHDSSNTSLCRDPKVEKWLKNHKTELDKYVSRVNQQYEPYKIPPGDEGDKLLGEVLYPYYELLCWAIRNNKDRVIDTVIYDIAFSLQAKGATILK